MYQIHITFHLLPPAATIWSQNLQQDQWVQQADLDSLVTSEHPDDWKAMPSFVVAILPQRQKQPPRRRCLCINAGFPVVVFCNGNKKETLPVASPAKWSDTWRWNVKNYAPSGKLTWKPWKRTIHLPTINFQGDIFSAGWNSCLTSAPRVWDIPEKVPHRNWWQIEVMGLHMLVK